MSRDIEALIRENNALRRNNERLTRENVRLREVTERQERDLITATTMGHHWKALAENRAERLEDIQHAP